MTTATNANIHDIAGNANDKINEAVNGKKSKITWWGFTWRTVSLTLLFVAAVVAIAFGMHFGIAYAAGAIANVAIATVVQYLIAFVGYLISGYAAVKVTTQISDWLGSAMATAAEKKATKS
jgi:hypothetical protein